jgi:hypothetical protein
MAHIDTLKTFDRLVASGVAPEKARIHSDILNASFDQVATKDDLAQGLAGLEKDLKYFFINSFVGFIYAPVIVGIIIALILKWVGKF